LFIGHRLDYLGRRYQIYPPTYFNAIAMMSKRKFSFIWLCGYMSSCSTKSRHLC